MNIDKIEDDHDMDVNIVVNDYDKSVDVIENDREMNVNVTENDHDMSADGIAFQSKGVETSRTEILNLLANEDVPHSSSSCGEKKIVDTNNLTN